MTDKQEPDTRGLPPLDQFCVKAVDLTWGDKIEISGPFAQKMVTEIQNMVAENIELKEANRVMKDELECDEVYDVEYDK